jgi:hypothetical protein
MIRKPLSTKIENNLQKEVKKLAIDLERPLNDLLGACRRTQVLGAVGKCSDARRPKFLGMRRTYRYAAVTKDEDNAADGGFPTAS